MSLKTKAYKFTALSLLLAPMALSTFQGATVAFAAPGVSQRVASTTIDVKLHKLLNKTTIDKVQNTGDEMDPSDFGLTSFVKLPGVTFEVFDISDHFYGARELGGDGLSAEDIYKGLEDFEYRIVEDPDTNVKTLEMLTSDVWTSTTAVFKGLQVTDSTGVANFNDLPKTTVVDEKTVGAVYIFLETDAPSVVTQKAGPMVLGLPAYRYDVEKGEYSDVELDEVHLYPKNETALGDVYGEKVIQTIGAEGVKQTPLVGAEFVVHTSDSDINNYTKADKIFLGAANPDTGVRPLVTIEEAEKFITREGGVLQITGLAQGDYLVSEISSTDGDNVLAGNTTVYNVPVIIDLVKEGDYDFIIDGALINDDMKVLKENGGEDLRYGEAETYTGNTYIPKGMNDQILKDEILVDFYTQYRFVDIHDKWLVLDEDSITVRIIESRDAENKPVYGDTIAPADYVVAIQDGTDLGDDNKTGFTIDFGSTTKSVRDILGAYAGQEIEVSYDMILDPGAPADENFNNKLTVDTGKDEANDKGNEVYTGGRKFIKVDGHSGAELAGAKFNVSNAAVDGEFLYTDADGKYEFLAEADVTADHNLVELTSDTDGKFEIQGLNYGTYFLKEIAVPSADYILPDGTFEFAVSSGSYKHDPTNGFGGPTAIVDQEVENFSKGTLPSTGGIGTIIFFLVGAVAMTGVVAVSRKKKA